MIAAPRRFCDLISDIFEPILLNAPVETPVVLERLAEVLSVLARAARRAEDVEAIGHLSTRLRTRVRDEDNPVRARIARGCDTVSEIVTASRHQLRRDSA